ELHRRGVPGPRGSGWWNTSTIARILRNRRYVGDWVYNRTAGGKYVTAKGGLVENRKAKRKPDQKHAPERKLPEEDWVIVPDWHPAIIDRLTFALVQARLAHNRERKTPHVGGGSFVLNQLLVCGQCGLVMWGFAERGQNKYRCSGNMRFGGD